MGKFGWSYPAGCNGPPDDEMPYDDTVCTHCGSKLPDEDMPDPAGWPFNGYCDALCALLHCIERATWPDDAPDGSDRMGSTRATVMKAIHEIRTQGDFR